VRTTTTTTEASLDRLVRGRVFRPGDAGYRVHTSVFNERHQHRARPVAVLVAADAGDVATAVRWARDRGVPIVARSGGHSFAGYSLNDGLVVDLSRLSLVTADGSTGLVTVGGGARVGHLYNGMRPYEMAISAGTNPLVGVAGLTLGGGADFTSRALGLTADALVATTVVLADGSVVTCDEREHADLFWACRGGGGGNFGINVSFTFQAEPVPDVATCQLTWGWEHAVDVLDVVQRVLPDAPDEFCVRLGVSTYGPDAVAAAGRRVVTLVAQLLGPSDDLRDLVAPGLAVAEPATASFADRTFWEAKGSTVHATSGGHFALKCNYATRPVAVDGLAAMVDGVERWPGSGNPDGGGVGMFSWGGRINRTPPDATAFAHRDTLFLVSMDTSWTGDDDPATVADNVRWLDGLHAAMADHLSAASYQNFVDPDLGDWQAAYYGGNYRRLVEVKQAYDPDGTFGFEQGIGR
jgi:FAD/FMN-containing dehydrogenase